MAQDVKLSVRVAIRVKMGFDPLDGTEGARDSLDMFGRECAGLVTEVLRNLRYGRSALVTL